MPRILEQIRSTYDGPLALATDLMVFNVTKDDIKVRMPVIEEDVWPLPSITETLPADPKDRVGFSDFIISGRVKFKEVVDKVYENTNKVLGTNVPPPE